MEKRASTNIFDVSGTKRTCRYEKRKPIPSSYKALPSTLDLVFRQLLHDELFLNIQIEREERLVDGKIVFAKRRGLEREDDWGFGMREAVGIGMMVVMLMWRTGPMSPLAGVGGFSRTAGAPWRFVVCHVAS
jgi:hypothetical protein